MALFNSKLLVITKRVIIMNHHKPSIIHYFGLWPWTNQPGNQLPSCCVPTTVSQDTQARCAHVRTTCNIFCNHCSAALTSPARAIASNLRRTQMYIPVHTYIYILLTCIYLYICKHMYIYTYKYIYICIHTQIDSHIYVYIYIYNINM